MEATFFIICLYIVVRCLEIINRSQGGPLGAAVRILSAVTILFTVVTIGLWCYELDVPR